MRTIAILGVSGHGQVVAESALKAGWDKVIFYDDDISTSKFSTRIPVLGDTEKLILDAHCYAGVVVAIGNNRRRLSKTELLINAGVHLVSIVHPFAYVSDNVDIAPGTVIFAGSVVQPGTHLGKAVIVNTGSTIDHDCQLGSGVHISPGAHLSGGVTIGECTWIGIGSTVIQGKSIGSDVIICAGATVISDFSDNITAVGVPARIIHHH
ncbi:MAG: acetyltransferase [Candidatus Sedimenticola endophacoides]